MVADATIHGKTDMIRGHATRRGRRTHLTLPWMLAFASMTEKKRAGRKPALHELSVNLRPQSASYSDSSGVMRRTVTRRFSCSSSSVGILRYRSPKPTTVRLSGEIA